MSGTEDFLQALRELMEDIPDGLTLNQLEWAIHETSLTLGVKIAVIHANNQKKKPIPGPIDQQTEPGGTHKS